MPRDPLRFARRSRALRAAAVALMLCLGFAGATAASPGKTLFVQGDLVNIRRAPSMEAPVLFQLGRGHRLIEIERRGPWVKVDIFRFVEKGWVHDSLVGPRLPEDAGAPPPEDQGPGADLEQPDTAVAPGNEFVLDVSGSPAMQYRGDCRVVNAAGKRERTRFKGFVPDQIALPAAAVFCVVQKWDSVGRLRVTLFEDGRAIARAETAAPFNYVHVRSAGPWGGVGGGRGAISFRFVGRDPAWPASRPLLGRLISPLASRPQDMRR